MHIKSTFIRYFSNACKLYMHPGRYHKRVFLLCIRPSYCLYDHIGSKLGCCILRKENYVIDRHTRINLDLPNKYFILTI